MTRAITVQPPWSDAIADGHKLIENRKAAPGWRGEFFIHSGARWSVRGETHPLLLEAYPQFRAALGDALGVPGLMAENFTFGAIVAVATLVDAHPAGGCCAPWGEDAYVEHPTGKTVRPVHLVLEDVRKLPEPVPCRGYLPLGWHVPDDVAALAYTQLRETP